MSLIIPDEHMRALGRHLDRAVKAFRAETGGDLWDFTIDAIIHNVEWLSLKEPVLARRLMDALSLWAAADTRPQMRAAKRKVLSARAALRKAIDASAAEVAAQQPKAPPTHLRLVADPVVETGGPAANLPAKHMNAFQAIVAKRLRETRRDLPALAHEHGLDSMAMGVAMCVEYFRDMTVVMLAADLEPHDFAGELERCFADTKQLFEQRRAARKLNS